MNDSSTVQRKEQEEEEVEEQPYHCLTHLAKRKKKKAKRVDKCSPTSGLHVQSSSRVGPPVIGAAPSILLSSYDLTTGLLLHSLNLHLPLD